MIKIIGGKHRGRALVTPEGSSTRPTASRAREALFNVLMHAKWREDGTSPLIDARILDGYAGSGALGLEALSRGAAHVCFVERSRRAAEAIDAVAREWRESSFEVAGADAIQWLDQQSSAAPRFDIVFLDPPYDSDLLLSAAAALARSGALATDARIYVERRARDPLPALPEGWKELRAGQAGEVGYHLFARAARGAEPV